MNTEKNIKQFLLDFGLTENEAELYLVLLKTGPNTIMNLSRESGIKRSTAHNNIEELIKKGFVTQTSYGERRMVVAEKPEKFKFLLDQKKWDLLKTEEELPNVIELLNQSARKEDSIKEFDIKYYEGEVGVRSIYREVVKSHHLRSYVNISKIFEAFPENPQLFPQNMKKGHLEMWEIIEDSPISREYIKTIDPEKYKFKFFPSKWPMSQFLDYMIYEGNVAIITFSRGNPSGIIISNRKIYENMKILFQIMWDLLPEPVID